MIYRDKKGHFIKATKVDSVGETKAEPSFPKSPQYLLRTCDENLQSYNGFQYPEKGYVEAPDWSPKPICGFGLHGLLMGKGDPELLKWDENVRWQILAIEPGTLVEIDKNKVKVPHAWVVLTGSRREATDFLLAHGAKTYEVPGAYFDLKNGETLFAGYRATVICGNESKVTCGNESKVICGNRAKVTCGNYSEVTCGYGSTVICGESSEVTCGNSSTVTCGNESKVTCGNYSEVTCGNYSEVTCGNYSEVTCGNYSEVTCGNDSKVICGNNSNVTCGSNSKVTCGDYSVITCGYDSVITCGYGSTVICGESSEATCGNESLMSFYYYDAHRKLQVLSGRTDENLKPNTQYRVENAQFVEV